MECVWIATLLGWETKHGAHRRTDVRVGANLVTAEEMRCQDSKSFGSISPSNATNLIVQAPYLVDQHDAWVLPFILWMGGKPAKFESIRTCKGYFFFCYIHDFHSRYLMMQTS